MSRVHFCSGLVPEDNFRSLSSIPGAVGRTPGSYEVKWGNCGDIGTGTKSSGINNHI